MRIAEALKIGELSEGTLITGHEGLNNIINSVEVMEVLKCWIGLHPVY